MATIDWPPYYSEHLYKQGPITEITRQVLAKLGYQLNVSFIPWKRAIEHTKKGVYHAVLGGYYNKQREKFFWYSEAIASVDLILFTHKSNNNPASDVNALSNKTVCVINGYYYGEKFQRNESIVKIKSNTLAHCFQRLISKRTEYVAVNKLVGVTLLEKEFPDYKQHLSITDTIISHEDVYILWSQKIPDNLQLNNEFNQVLQELKETGELKKIWLQFGFNEG